jgi:transposase
LPITGSIFAVNREVLPRSRDGDRPVAPGLTLRFGTAKMERLVLSDAAWERMALLIIGRPDQKGSTGRDNRMFVEGVLWIVRTGSPGRDLPEAFSDWNSRFRRENPISRSVGVGMGAADLALARQLAVMTGAPSLSALVRTALRNEFPRLSNG